MHPTARSPKRTYFTALALAIVAGLLTATGALAAGPGSLDPAFGTNGYVITDLGSTSDIGDGVVLQSDGKILVSGSATLDSDFPGIRTPVVVRYNSNGTIDTSYGTNGRVTTEVAVPTGMFKGSRLALQSNGKLVVGGSFRNDIGVVRYNTNGTLDTTFGTAGIGTVQLSEDSRETCSDVAIQPNGKIVLAGSEEIGNYVYYFIARFNSDGTPDLTFNERGFQLDPAFPNNRYNFGQAVAIQVNGKIVMSGTMSTDNDGGGPWLTLARYNTDGSVDSTFGTNGAVKITSQEFQSNNGALALQSDGKIVVGGTRLGDLDPTTDDLAVARLNTNGSLDTTFGGTGIVVGDFGNDEDGHDVLIQQGGKIVVVGKKSNNAISGFVLARYNSNGSLDTSFGTNGQVVSDFGGSGQSANAAALQPDGKIIAAGTSGGNVAVARYYGAQTDIQYITDSFLSYGDYDGWVLESSETSGVGNSLNKLATTFNVGDDAKDRQYRGLLSFNTKALPDTAVITGAELKVKRQNVVGTDPFKTHGNLLLVIRLGTFSNNVALQPGDFSASGSAGSVKDPFTPLTYSWYHAALNTANLPFINKYGVTQFRLQFQLDDNDDLGADYMKFFSGNSDPANAPVLLITYFIP